MKMLKLLLFLLLTGALFSCEKEKNNIIIKDKIEGFVQKGPFINGTSITISELNQKLMPTGRIFNTQIIDNKGSFQLNNVSLSSQFVELKADGFYFNEVSGNSSSAPLILYALSDLSDRSSINVNVLSYLEKARVEYLIANGSEFPDAKKQAQREILAVFNIQKENISQSENLDISQMGEDNAILLAVSVILQGKRSVAELSELLANFSTDIREDGVLNSRALGSKLINDVKYLDLSSVRQHVQNRYADLGINTEIPDFEHFVHNFIDNTSFIYNFTFTYPANGLYGANFLNAEHNTVLNSAAKYSLSADIPSESSLKVVIKAVEGLWYLNATSIDGWHISDFDSQTHTQTFTANQTGRVIDLELALSESGSCIVEYYENDKAEPSIVKTINWAQSIIFSYPATGQYGVNLLNLDNDSQNAAQEYSLALNLPADNEYSTEIKLLFEGTGTYTIDQAKVQNWLYTASNNELLLTCSGKGTNADMAITLSGEGKLTIQSPDLNKVIHWK